MVIVIIDDNSRRFFSQAEHESLKKTMQEM